MSTPDDEPIEFDFFDEPETVEATQRRRLPRLDRSGGRGGDGGERPPRRPLRAPTGLVPLARLVGAIAIAIVVVVGLVFWVGSCQGKSKHEEYQSYVDTVKPIASRDARLGQTFAAELVAATKQSDLVTKLQTYADQERLAWTAAQQVRPPGPLRALHQNLVDAIELRWEGLLGLADALAPAGAVKNQGTAATLAKQGQLLTAGDVVWEQLYRLPATTRLKEKGVTGVVIPGSLFVTNTEVVSARSFGILLNRLSGTASTGGTPSGKHGDGVLSVKVMPQGDVLSKDSATTIKVSADLAFVVTVEDSGDFQEVNVPVTLTIDAGGTPIKKHETIQLIQPAEQKTVTFTKFDVPPAAFGNQAKVTVFVAPVNGEVNTSNNTATYTVFFTLS